MTGYGKIVVGAVHLCVFGRQGVADGSSGGEKNTLTPNDGRGMAFARQSDLPANVFVFAPFYRRIGVWSDTGCEGSAPLRPLVLSVVETVVTGPH